MTKIGIVLAVIIVVIALFGMNRERHENEAVPSPIATVEPTMEATASAEVDLESAEFDEFFEDSFIEGCIESGDVGVTECRCYYKELSKDYSNLEMIGMVTQEDDVLMEMLFPYILKCQ